MDQMLDYAFSAGNLWAVLFVYLFLMSRKEAQEREKESREREKKLISNIDLTNEQHLKITGSMESLERGMQTLSNQFNSLSTETREGFSRVWERFGEIKK